MSDEMNQNNYNAGGYTDPYANQGYTPDNTAYTQQANDAYVYNNEANVQNSTSAQAPKKERNGKEMAALICGFVAVGCGVLGCCCGFLSIIGLAAGIVSLVFYKKIAEESGALEGADKASQICAIVGIVFGALGAIGIIINLVVGGGSMLTSIIESTKYSY